MAGREGPGTCYRLYTEADFNALPAQPVPEVCRVSVAATVLGLLATGLSSAEVIDFPWLQPPPRPAQLEAFTLLHRLRAISPPGTAQAPGPAAPLPTTLSGFAAHALTPHGHAMAAMPLTPMYGNLLLHAAASGVGGDAAAIVALLSVDNVWVNPGRERRGALDAARKKFASLEGDHTTLLNVFRSFERVVATAAREAAAGRAKPAPGGSTPTVVTYGSDDEADPAAAGAGGSDMQEWVVRGGGGGSGRGGGEKGGTKRQGLGPGGGAAAQQPLASLSATSCATAIDRAIRSAPAAGPAAGGGGGAKAALRAITSRALQWCVEHFVSMRSLRRAVAIRDQLADICAAAGVDLTRKRGAAEGGEGDPTAAGLRHALALGCWLQAAVRLPAEPGAAGGRPGYRPLVPPAGGGPPPVYHVHPGSVLVLVHSYVRNRQAAAAAARLVTGRHGAEAAGGGADAALLGLGYPEAVVFGELVFTGKAYMRQCTRVELAWLAEACPEALPHTRAAIA